MSTTTRNAKTTLIAQGCQGAIPWRGPSVGQSRLAAPHVETEAEQATRRDRERPPVSARYAYTPGGPLGNR